MVFAVVALVFVAAGVAAFVVAVAAVMRCIYIYIDIYIYTTLMFICDSYGICFVAAVAATVGWW